MKGLAAVVTTFGVGELSAINAIAGAFSEQVPVVHIVGVPSTQSQRDGMLLHHTLGNGDFNVFANMSREISVGMAKIMNITEAVDQVDSVLQKCFMYSRPVYISLPTDLAEKMVEGEQLKTPIDLSLAPNDKDRETAAIKNILEGLYAAKNPVILVDACAIRHRVSGTIQGFRSCLGYF